MNTHLIAITGESGSGKTWLAQRLLENFHPIAGRLSLDDFYHDLSHRPRAEREQTNFDHPAAIDWPHFHQCLSGILRGDPVELPDYDFSTHTRRARPKIWTACRLVVLDGLWLLHPAELRRLYTISVFVECPEDRRLERRLARDQQERGRSAASVRAQFKTQAGPMHDQFVAPQSLFADFVMPSPTPTAQLKALLVRCQQLLDSGGPQ